MEYNKTRGSLKLPLQSIPYKSLLLKRWLFDRKTLDERDNCIEKHLGLDVDNIQTYNAEAPKSRRAYLTTIREYFARVKMFIDLITYDDKMDRE